MKTKFPIHVLGAPNPRAELQSHGAVCRATAKALDRRVHAAGMRGPGGLCSGTGSSAPELRNRGAHRQGNAEDRALAPSSQKEPWPVGSAVSTSACGPKGCSNEVQVGVTILGVGTAGAF